MNNLKHLLYDYLVSLGLSEGSAKYLNMFALLLALLLLVFIVDYLTRKILVNAFMRFSSRSKSNFDDILVTNKAPRNIAHIFPLLIALEFIPIVFSDFNVCENVVEKGFG